MAVFTEVSEQAARALLRLVPLGRRPACGGIEGGIENTNYFLSTDQGAVGADAVRAPERRATALYLT